MKNQFEKLNPLASVVKLNLLNLPTPSNISYMWNMGSMLGFTLVIQIMSGVMLAMHYSSSESVAFSSTIFMTRNNSGMLLIRAIHSNMASVFFALVYTHIFRGLLNSSFSKVETWLSGVSILFLLMATAFLGYVLPWGQMSFWGATVITNLASTVPFLGDDIVLWLWGGFSVSDPTLNRFFPLHFLVPFIISGFALVHLMTLHLSGSSNPVGIMSKIDMTYFNPLFSWKDILMPSLVFSLVLLFSVKSPDIMMDSENFIPANPMMAPVHIQPEWYFLFAYAILRSIPNKLGGVIALLMSILIILVPCFSKVLFSASKYSPLRKFSMWSVVSSFAILTILGAKPMEFPYMDASKLVGVVYFISILV